jgi:DNA-binding NtrC family response regulator
MTTSGSSGPRSVRPVLLLNGYEDMVEMLRMTLETAGFPTITGDLDRIRRTMSDLQAVVTAHDPGVVIYDIAPPYDRSWNYLQTLRTQGPLKDRPLVLTTTNERRLREMVSTPEAIIEIFGKPYDSAQVVDAVSRLMKISR